MKHIQKNPRGEMLGFQIALTKLNFFAFKTKRKPCAIFQTRIN